eukprot:1190969-Prorocentrum_minimum.AAC.4
MPGHRWFARRQRLRRRKQGPGHWARRGGSEGPAPEAMVAVLVRPHGVVHHTSLSRLFVLVQPSAPLQRAGIHPLGN